MAGPLMLEACAIITGIDEDIVRTGNAHLEYKVRLAASAPSEAAPWFPMALKLKQVSLGQWASLAELARSSVLTYVPGK